MSSPSEYLQNAGCLYIETRHVYNISFDFLTKEIVLSLYFTRKLTYSKALYLTEDCQLNFDTIMF